MNSETDIQHAALAYFRDQAPVLHFTLTADAEIADANRFAKDLTGRDLVGERFQDVVIDFKGRLDLAGAARDPSRERLLSIATASGLPQSFYFTFRRVASGMTAFGRLDAQEMADLQKEMLSLNRDLNNLTRALHQKNAQLKRLDAEKNRFLGMATHDLRGPIGLILSYTGFLLEDIGELLDEEQTGFLDKIQASSLFMRGLVEDFLDISAIEAGRLELDLHPANLEAVLMRSLEICRLKADQKRIDLKIDCDDRLPTVETDDAKIQQVITNLVTNAIEHSESGHPVVVSLKAQDRAVRCSVQDEGPGIAPGEIDGIFEPYGKSSTRKTAGEKSTGLGMLIARKIIEAHGGRLWVDSQVGRGTTMNFELTRAKENQ